MFGLIYGTWGAITMYIYSAGLAAFCALVLGVLYLRWSAMRATGPPVHIAAHSKAFPRAVVVDLQVDGAAQTKPNGHRAEENGAPDSPDLKQSSLLDLPGQSGASDPLDSPHMELLLNTDQQLPLEEKFTENHIHLPDHGRFPIV